MPLTSGTKLGPYEIQVPLGAGGMGEVYRARDTRLERTVAIKILNSALVASPELKARFEREAKTISQLNHPNICVLHDIGHEGGTDFLVMEFLDGESLAERLKRGPLPLKEVVSIGCDIADALDRAHRAGVVHRDLKPGNVMLTKTGAKLLDFGLAKPAAVGATAGSGSAPLLSAAMTMTSPSPQPSPLTQQGAFVGTVQYMSPEQIRGAEADARSDIFAFGAVLYEMAAGKRPFEGKSQLGVASAIVEKDPEPVRTVVPGTPLALDRLIATMLEKQPEQRWQCAADVKRTLEAVPQLAAAAAVAAETPPWKRALPWAVAAIAVAVALVMFAVSFRPAPQRRVVSSLNAQAGSTFEITGDRAAPPAVSPRGTKIVYGAGGKLWLRELDHDQPRALEGTEGAVFPFWSPDGKNIGLFLGGKLQTMDIAGGAPVSLCDAQNARGGTWSKDGFILFVPTIRSPIMKVAVTGGAPVAVTKLDASLTTHRWPQMLPDGRHFIYFAANHANPLGDTSAEYLTSVDGGEAIRLVHVTSSAMYAAGQLLFLRGTALNAQTLDLGSQRLTGDPFVVASDVDNDLTTWHGLFSATDTGVLVYRSGGSETGKAQWFGANGQTEEVLSDTPFAGLAFSPDESQILEIGNPQGELWLAAANGSTRTKLGLADNNEAPVWSPDGRRVAFAHIGSNAMAQVFVQPTDGSSPAHILHKEDAWQSPTDWSKDGKYILYERGEPGDANIWVMPADGTSPLFPFIRSSSWVRDGRFSPDGKWVAFESRGTGGDEVYITRFPGPGPNWQVSHSGGHGPRWSADGKWLYFWKPNNTELVRVTMETPSETPRIGDKEEPVLKASAFANTSYDPVYGVSRSGRVLVSTVGTSNTLTLVNNWTLATK